MITIRATWTSGQIISTEPVPWPEGTALDVQPARPAEKIGLDESEWDDSLAAIARRSTWLKTLEAPPLADAEEQANREYAERFRQFQLDAVRKKWQEMETP